MFIYHSLAKGVGEFISGHNRCSDISESGADQEETHLPNVAKAVGNVANVATVKLEEIPSHSSNMKNIVEDSGLGGCSSLLNNSPRKHRRRRKEDLPGEGIIEPAIGTPGKHFSNPEVNTKSSETKNLPHHPLDQPTLAFVDYIRVSEEKPKYSSSMEETDLEESLDQPSPEAEQGGKVTGENSEGDPLPTYWPPVKKRKKKRILKTSRTDQKKIERSMQGDAITDNNVWEDNSKNEVTTNSEILKERGTATEHLLDKCGTMEDTNAPGKGIEISAVTISGFQVKPTYDTSELDAWAVELVAKSEHAPLKESEIEPQEKEVTRGDIWEKPHNEPTEISGIPEKAGNHFHLGDDPLTKHVNASRIVKILEYLDTSTNRRKVKLTKKTNREWRWRNKRKIKLLKLLKKALSTAPEPPGMNITNKGKTSTESEPRRNVELIMESGGTDLDLTANIESLDGGQNMEDTQLGSRETEQGPARRGTRRRTAKQFTPPHGSHPPPPSEGGVNSNPSRSRWLNAKRDQPPRTRRAKHVYPYQKLKWYKQIGGHLNYNDDTRCPRGPIKPIGPDYKIRKAGPPNKTKGRTGGRRTEKHPTDEVTESTSQSGTHCLKPLDSVGAEGDHQKELMDTAQGCPGNNMNLQKPVKHDLQYHHISPVQGESDGEARAADNSAVDDDGTTEGSAEGIESKIFDKPQDGFFGDELPLNLITRHLKLGNTQEKHIIKLPTELGYIHDPAVSPDEEGIMNVSAEIKYSTSYDVRRRQFVNYKSRRQPYVLCQIQEFRPEGGLEGFKPRRVKVGKFLADTGAQINVGNLTVFDLLGFPRSEFHARTRDASHMKVHGIGGVNVPGLRALEVMIYSLKTNKSVPVTFFLSDALKANRLS